MTDSIVSDAILSHPGCVRDVNEDSIAFAIPEILTATGGPSFIAIVADGMGGHSAGEIASRIAVDTILGAHDEIGDSIPQWLARTFAAANEAILTHAQSEPDCAGMGTTCTVLVMRNGTIHLGHIGDSRAYQYRSGVLSQISEDHSAVGELVRAGKMTAAEAKNSPFRNIIQRALGTKPKVSPQIWHDPTPAEQGDAFLICSDGLTNLLDDEILARFITHRTPLDACQLLLEKAISAGAPDNVSVGVFSVQASTGTPPPGKQSKRAGAASSPT